MLLTPFLRIMAAVFVSFQTIACMFNTQLLGEICLLYFNAFALH